MIREFLTHPLMRGKNLDDPQTTQLRRSLIRQKKFLEKIYIEWYQIIYSQLDGNMENILELGSGAGFLDEFIPNLIKSDIFYLIRNDIVLDGLALPFKYQSLTAIVMSDVFHHIPDTNTFFDEVSRSLKPGGRLVMIEPWVSTWSNWVYPHLHHEGYEPKAKNWGFPSVGPLSSSNQALPWIVFMRDRLVFESAFPQFHIIEIRPFMPFRYILSGGVSLRSFMPGWSFELWRRIEGFFSKSMDRWAMFALITVERM
jgi:SAM-dependent methyltransferase